MVDHSRDAGAQHFHGGLAAIRKRRKMHLRHRCRGNRLTIEAGEDVVHRPLERAFQFRYRQFRCEWWHLILQLGQFVDKICRHQIAAGRQHLTELDEYRPQRLERQPQPNSAGPLQIAPEEDRADQPGWQVFRIVIENQPVKTEGQSNTDYLGKT